MIYISDNGEQHLSLISETIKNSHQIDLYLISRVRNNICCLTDFFYILGIKDNMWFVGI